LRGAPELDDAHGVRVNKKLIQHIMRELGISGLPARRRAKPNLINRATSTDLQSGRCLRTRRGPAHGRAS